MCADEAKMIITSVIMITMHAWLENNRMVISNFGDGAWSFGVCYVEYKFHTLSGRKS